MVYSDLLAVEPVKEPLPLADQVTGAQDATTVPGLVGVRPAPGPEATTRVLFDDGPLEESVLHAVFVHPGTGHAGHG